jgi:CheY-like chemotaxis protein
VGLCLYVAEVDLWQGAWKGPSLDSDGYREAWRAAKDLCFSWDSRRAGRTLGAWTASSVAPDSSKGNDGDPRKSYRILIADDHEAVRRGLRSALAGAGWLICGEAVDGRDAIEKTLELKPDLLILDVSMPKLGGLEAAREILKLSKETKILVFTMHESKQIRDETAAIGVHGLAVKSAPLSTLLATIDSLFQQAH